MDVDALLHRLRDAPLHFFSAASSSSNLSTFYKEWHSLCGDVDKASHLLLLNDANMSLVHATATQIATWSELLLKVDDEAAIRTTNFIDEMENVFAQLTIDDLHPAARPAISTSKYPRSSHSTFAVTPSYVAGAYSWMLQNIHDPYPSNEVKVRISRDAGRPLRVITDWFKTIRRQIGWVALCKSHFDGSRTRAIEAAKYAYLGATSQSSPSPEIISQFEAIRMRLRDMYPMIDDNGDLSDSTDDSFTSSPSSSRGSPYEHSSYAGSRSSSSTPSLVFSTDDEDDHSLTSFTSEGVRASLGKRKHASEEVEVRSLERNRFISVADGLVKDVIAVSPAASAALTTNIASDLSPSPSSALSRKRRLSDAVAEWEDVTPLSSSLTQSDSRPPLCIPKRRLSVSDSQPTPKRPCLPPAVGPRKQAVSTPVPIAHQTTPAADEWFPFELPDTSLSVELFNWDVVVENDAFLYNSLFDNILQSDGQDFSNVTPLSDAYQSLTTLDLGISSAVRPSDLDISSAFTEPPPTQSMAPISTPPPITATTTPVFDFLDAFLSAVNAESAEPHTTQSSSRPSTELSLNDTIDLFGESMP